MVIKSCVDREAQGPPRAVAGWLWSPPPCSLGPRLGTVGLLQPSGQVAGRAGPSTLSSGSGTVHSHCVLLTGAEPALSLGWRGGGQAPPSTTLLLRPHPLPGAAGAQGSAADLTPPDAGAVTRCGGQTGSLRGAQGEATANAALPWGPLAVGGLAGCADRAQAPVGGGHRWFKSPLAPGQAEHPSQPGTPW